MFDWIVGVVRSLGYAGIGLLTLLENVVPPIPSELVMPFAGFIAERGELSFLGAVAAGTGGSFLGAGAWYLVGRRVGEQRVRGFFRRHGRWAALSGEEIDRATEWFRRHGWLAVFVGRLVPGVRTFISLPAGFAGMNLFVFVVFTLLGTAIWTAALTWAGVVLGRNYDAVETYVGPATWLVVGGLVAWYAYRVATYDRTNDEAELARDA